MALRTITLAIQATLTQSDALLLIDTSYIQKEISKALQQGGFIVNNVSAQSNYNSSYTAMAVTQAEDYISDEALRLYAQQLIANHQTFTNYGLFNSSYYHLFSAVTVRIVNEQTIPTNIDYKDLQKQIADQNTLWNLLGLNSETGKNLAIGAGVSTPVVLAVGLVLLVLYLKK